MKMTFAIPDDLGRRFRKAVPPGERSAVVAEVLRKKLRPSGRELAAVCRRVNQLTGLEKDLAGWRFAANSRKSSATLYGLTTGKRYWLRVTA